ncbi:hypothetical protein ASG29_04530 [Sphingomonas sp. Leaf412]|uniref:DUF4893 domain-containing protein n=1 Tax=Sphingomonas sp. Leaf412 TaxID=1736370 RepID=UPI0006F912AA|nr:DUF4893 domain-containing protein [Sphingomonas sp. Leaf412]KQT33335.1 hypothetical protein ASG29_04530 [Sphingomonas sp. Leaf412]
MTGLPALSLLAAPAAAQTDWRRVATPTDRARLADWRTVWAGALARARAGGAGAEIAAAGALFDYDRALPRPVPPAGDYRCRIVKLGAAKRWMLPYVAYPFFACRVAVTASGAGETVTLAKLTGSQRQVGTIHPRDGERAVFLGTLMYGYEDRPLPYGRDAKRDVAGWVERIGERRWRMAMPSPAFESMLDVMELVPVD